MIEAEHFASQEIADRISDTAARIERIQEKRKVTLGSNQSHQKI